MRQLPRTMRRPRSNRRPPAESLTSRNARKMNDEVGRYGAGSVVFQPARRLGLGIVDPRMQYVAGKAEWILRMSNVGLRHRGR